MRGLTIHQWFTWRDWKSSLLASQICGFILIHKSFCSIIRRLRFCFFNHRGTVGIHLKQILEWATVGLHVRSYQLRHAKKINKRKQFSTGAIGKPEVAMIYSVENKDKTFTISPIAGAMEYVLAKSMLSKLRSSCVTIFQFQIALSLPWETSYLCLQVRGMGW